MAIVEAILHPKGNRKVEIFRQPNGVFGFEEWRWDAEERYGCPLGGHSTAVIDTMDHALDEVNGRISWIREKSLST
jgi:hypothetical protein